MKNKNALVCGLRAGGQGPEALTDLINHVMNSNVTRASAELDYLAKRVGEFNRRYPEEQVTMKELLDIPFSTHNFSRITYLRYAKSENSAEMLDLLRRHGVSVTIRTANFSSFWNGLNQAREGVSDARMSMYNQLLSTR